MTGPAASFHLTRTTVAALCIGMTGQIPTPGPKVDLPGGVVIEVLSSSQRRIRAVRIRR